MPLLFNLPDKRIALYNTSSKDKNINTFDGIFLKAENKTLYSDAVPKAIDFSSDESIKALDNKIKELTSESADWQQILKDYAAMMSRIIFQGEKIKDYSSFIVNKVKINQILNIHEINTSKALFSYKTKSYQDKITLSLLADKTFDQLRGELNLSIPQPSKLDYVLDVPSEQVYEVFATSDIVTNLGSKAELIVSGKKLLLQKKQSNENLLQFENIHIDKKQNVDISLRNLQYDDLVEKAPWHTFDGSPVNPATVTFSLNDLVGNSQGLFRQIEFKPNTLYFVSFDYKTNGQNFWTNFYEIVDNPGGNPSKIANQLSADSLRSVGWKTINTVIQTGYNPNAELLLQIMPRDDKTDYLLLANTQDKIQVKNLSAVQIPQAQIILRKLYQSKNLEDSLPEITFRKINPTKYFVEVRNAKNPYTLVFSQAFQENWKLFLAHRESEEKSVVQSYFSDQIRERASQDAFLEKSTFETWGQDAIAQDKHYLVNGYANSWYIEPKDTNGAKDYTLVIELTTQRSFYVSLAISLLTFLGCILWLVIALFKRNKFL